MFLSNVESDVGLALFANIVSDDIVGGKSREGVYGTWIMNYEYRIKYQKYQNLAKKAHEKQYTGA